MVERKPTSEEFNNQPAIKLAREALSERPQHVFPVYIDQGGLFRCCVNYLIEHGATLPKDEPATCPHCGEQLVVEHRHGTPVWKWKG